jgi:GrpB-like predicted nucleotidyltransferase (UPF0157 family)
MTESPRNVVVVAYDPQWPARFAQEAARLAPVFGDSLVTIHHIGSTSIPGMAAKPIIDMLPVVRQIEAVDALNPGMEALGYAPRGEFGIPGRRYFAKGQGAQRSHHVHVFAVDHPDIARHLIFRDYLIAHPAEAAAYASLKQALARQFPHDMEAYIAGKDGLIKEIDRRAAAWRSELPGP